MARYDLGDEEPYVIIEKKEGSVGSLLLGIALGAGVALLFAPRSGEDTRADLRRRARDASDAARDAAQDVMDTAVGAVEEARRAVDDRVGAVREAVDIKRRQVTRAVDAGRAAATQAREDIERRLEATKAAYQAGVDVARDTRAARPPRTPRTTGPAETTPTAVTLDYEPGG